MADSERSTPAPGVIKYEAEDYTKLKGSVDALVNSGLVKREWLQDGKTPFGGFRNGKQRIARHKKQMVDGRVISTEINPDGIRAKVLIYRTDEEIASRSNEHETSQDAISPNPFQEKYRSELLDSLTERTCATFNCGDVVYDEISEELVEISGAYAFYDVREFGRRWGYLIRRVGGQEFFSPAGALYPKDGGLQHLKLIDSGGSRSSMSTRESLPPDFPRAS